jgi:hypothetical protein
LVVIVSLYVLLHSNHTIDGLADACTLLSFLPSVFGVFPSLIMFAMEQRILLHRLIY